MYGGGFGAEGDRRELPRPSASGSPGLLAHLSDADRAKVFGGTAAKLFKLTG